MEARVVEDKRRERLRFRSWHRGTREMDLLLGSFADAHLGAFTEAQLDTFERLLEVSDPSLYEWISGQGSVPPETKSDVMTLLLAHRFVGKEAS